MKAYYFVGAGEGVNYFDDIVVTFEGGGCVGIGRGRIEVESYQARHRNGEGRH